MAIAEKFFEVIGQR